MSIAKNYIFNVVYQIITLIIPLITVPYISRVLGSKGVGINAYTYSVIQYFVLFGTIGISLYGNRAIAYVREDKKKLSETFWSIFVLKLITTFLAYIVFIIFLEMVGSYEHIFLLQSFYLLAAMIDISWLFMGLEDFKKTVTRNLFIKIMGALCIFLFVKTSNDLWKYVFILALSQFLGQLTMWIYIPATVNKIKIDWKKVKSHLASSISLFIPQIAIQIYVVLNKTMLGLMSNTNEVGFFDNADKIVKMVLSVVTAMGIVMLPRVSNTFAKGDISKVNSYLYQSFDFASYLSFPLMFGLMAIADKFTPWFFGPGFIKTGSIMMMISPIIVLIAWSNVIGQQYMMPTGKIQAYTLSVIIGAIVNFILNLILIPQYHAVGTAIATFVAEFTVTFLQLVFLKGEIDHFAMFRSLWKYFLSSLIMYAIILIITSNYKASLSTTLMQVIIGIVLYPSLLILFKSQLNKKLLKKGLRIISKAS